MATIHFGPLRLGGGKRPGALDYANRLYDRRGLTAFDPENPIERNKAVGTSIAAGLDQLGGEERARLSEFAMIVQLTDATLA